MEKREKLSNKRKVQQRLPSDQQNRDTVQDAARGASCRLVLSL